VFDRAATELGSALVWRCFGLSGSTGFFRSASCGFGGGSLWAFGLGGGGASVASALSCFGRSGTGLWRLRRCDRGWRRQVRRLVHRHRRVRRWDGLSLGHLRPWRDLCGGDGGATASGAKSIMTAGGGASGAASALRELRAAQAAAKWTAATTTPPLEQERSSS
jgi:hypothetical protein